MKFAEVDKFLILIYKTWRNSWLAPKFYGLSWLVEIGQARVIYFAVLCSYLRYVLRWDVPEGNMQSWSLIKLKSVDCDIYYHVTREFVTKNDLQGWFKLFLFEIINSLFDIKHRHTDDWAIVHATILAEHENEHLRNLVNRANSFSLYALPSLFRSW